MHLRMQSAFHVHPSRHNPCQKNQPRFRRCFTETCTCVPRINSFKRARKLSAELTWPLARMYSRRPQLTDWCSYPAVSSCLCECRSSVIHGGAFFHASLDDWLQVCRGYNFGHHSRHRAPPCRTRWFCYPCIRSLLRRCRPHTSRRPLRWPADSH